MGHGAAGGDRRQGANRRRKLEGLYRGLAQALRRFHGWRAVVLCGNPLLEAAMGGRRYRTGLSQQRPSGTGGPARICAPVTHPLDRAILTRNE